MNYLLLIAGIIILLIVIGDIAFTTLSSNGAGFLTDTITKGLWHTSLFLCRHNGSRKTLEYVGILTVIAIISTWFILMWGAFSMIVCADSNSVIHSKTQRTADVLEKIYYTGFSFTTLGVGDYNANGDAWCLFTVVISLSGFLLISTAITYMLPVLSAEVKKKALSQYITNLGGSPQEILARHWKDNRFKGLETHFSTLIQTIDTYSQLLLAYPILYCFHSARVTKSTAVTIAKLDETLTILLLYIPEEHRPSNQAIYPLRNAITSFLVTQNEHFIKLKNSDPIQPDLESLRKLKIPLSDAHQDIDNGYDKLAKRRKLLGSMLRNEGWDFKVIYEEAGKHQPEYVPDLEL